MKAITAPSPSRQNCLSFSDNTDSDNLYRCLKSAFSGDRMLKNGCLKMTQPFQNHATKIAQFSHILLKNSLQEQCSLL